MKSRGVYWSRQVEWGKKFDKEIKYFQNVKSEGYGNEILGGLVIPQKWSWDFRGETKYRTVRKVYVKFLRNLYTKYPYWSCKSGLKQGIIKVELSRGGKW